MNAESNKIKWLKEYKNKNDELALELLPSKTYRLSGVGYRQGVFDQKKQDWEAAPEAFEKFYTSKAALVKYVNYLPDCDVKRFLVDHLKSGAVIK